MRCTVFPYRPLSEPTLLLRRHFGGTSVASPTPSLQGGTSNQPSFVLGLRPSKAHRVPVALDGQPTCGGDLRRRRHGHRPDLHHLPTRSWSHLEDFHVAWAAREALKARSPLPPVPVPRHRVRLFWRAGGGAYTAEQAVAHPEQDSRRGGRGQGNECDQSSHATCSIAGWSPFLF
jgi:hypothetical protein